MNPLVPEINLLGLDRRGCEDLVVAMGYKGFHGRNLLKWIHKHGVDCAAMTGHPMALWERLVLKPGSVCRGRCRTARFGRYLQVGVGAGRRPTGGDGGDSGRRSGYPVSRWRISTLW